ncbi:MAG: lipopolysaccharide biosynthesis protein [Fibrobacter sp.]|jgi:O-antigen/teichoic acid export membrane protein|nr:lipopolysaccharide biosynthesis protein [Fibrobacter sp.]
MSLKQKTFKGVIWSAVERFSTQGVQFLFGILLARLLTPNDYGMIAMLTIFMAVSQTFIDSGFGNALIRKPDRNEADKATVFFFNIFMAAACYGIIFLGAPFVAQFYKMPQLSDILRILAINLIIQAFGSIQRLNLTIDLNFKTLAKVSLIGAIVGGTAGLISAYNGLGVWSLVIQQMVTTSTRVVLFWTLVHWRPKTFFNKTSFKNMFGFGSKLLISGLLNTLYENVYDLIIGKVFSAGTLGNYSRASHFANFPSSNINGIFQRVTFPVLSKIQNDHDKLRVGYLKFLNMATLVVFPLMIGLSALAKPFILLVLTDKWVDAILILQIICFAQMWYPVHSINLNMLQVLGRSDLFLKLEIIKKVAGITILCVAIPHGIIAICYSQWVSACFGLIVNTYYSGKLLNAGLLTQLKMYIPTLLNSLIMGAICIGVTKLLPEKEYALQLVLGIAAGAVYYIASNCIFNRETVKELLELLNRKKNKS